MTFLDLLSTFRILDIAKCPRNKTSKKRAEETDPWFNVTDEDGDYNAECDGCWFEFRNANADREQAADKLLEIDLCGKLQAGSFALLQVRNHPGGPPGRVSPLNNDLEDHPRQQRLAADNNVTPRVSKKHAQVAATPPSAKGRRPSSSKGFSLQTPTKFGFAPSRSPSLECAVSMELDRADLVEASRLSASIKGLKERSWKLGSVDLAKKMRSLRRGLLQTLADRPIAASATAEFLLTQNCFLLTSAKPPAYNNHISTAEWASLRNEASARHLSLDPDIAAFGCDEAARMLSAKLENRGYWPNIKDHNSLSESQMGTVMKTLQSGLELTKPGRDVHETTWCLSWSVDNTASYGIQRPDYHIKEKIRGIGLSIWEGAASGRAHRPMRMASRYGHTAVVEVLLAGDRADPAANNDRATRYASRGAHTAILELLLADERTDPAARGNEAMWMASPYGLTAVVELLLADERTDPAARNNKALCAASSYGHTAVVELLLADERTDPAARNNEAIWQNEVIFGEFKPLVHSTTAQPKITSCLPFTTEQPAVVDSVKLARLLQGSIHADVKGKRPRVQVVTLHNFVRASARRVYATVQVAFSRSQDAEKARAAVKGAGNPGNLNDLTFNKKFTEARFMTAFLLGQSAVEERKVKKTWMAAKSADEPFKALPHRTEKETRKIRKLVKSYIDDEAVCSDTSGSESGLSDCLAPGDDDEDDDESALSA
ncbi:hypothetical protein HDU87_006279 [Geranomyces variabilis]|uniref:Ankyrin repeat protein n=1 Tax=Geranomyces variabilis TaxID=109894 RepID=A0AAD5TH81_9FUNG|nr:hypothetical protein HDU87_006279 [Geranomyces variabilis]